jgi:hypothetical protein
MTAEAVGVAWAIIWPPVWAPGWMWATRRLLGGRPLGGYWGSWLTASVTTLAEQALAGDLPAALVGIASTVFAVIMWWLSRRRKRRAPKLAGAKSKALLAAIVARMRETLKPRPILRPVPGGAR